MAERVTNATLAALMTEFHSQTSRRLDAIDNKQAVANGRLGKAELAIAVLEDARRTAIGAVQATEAADAVSIPKKWIAVAAAIGTALGAILVKWFAR